jgi:hypothetical protein
MALLHRASLTPGKLELASGWAREQLWFAGEPDAEFTQVGNFRFDDPDGEVGIETLLIRGGDGPVVALTVERVPETTADAGPLVLTGTWTGHPDPAVLASARLIEP